MVVADLTRDANGRITGYQGLARVTTSTTEGVGSYFPAFFPDGKLFYVANSTAQRLSIRALANYHAQAQAWDLYPREHRRVRS